MIAGSCRALSARSWSFASIGIAMIVALPMLAILFSITQDSEGEWSYLARTRLPVYARNTLWLCVGVVTLSTLIGVATAWLVTRCRFAGSRVFTWALLLPLATPAYLGAYVYTDLLQFAGPVQTWIRETFSLSRGDYWFPPIRSLFGAIVVLSLSLYPYVFLAARMAFMEASACALEASRTLGMGPWRTFFRVALPLARPAIVAGASLVLMETIADFGAVDHFAIDTFATGIYRTWIGVGSLTAAAQLSACVLACVMVLLAIEQLARRGARYHGATSRQRPAASARLGFVAQCAAVVVCAAPIVFGFIVPLSRFVQLALRRGDARAAELFLGHGYNTIKVAAIASVVAAALALMLAYARRLRPTAITHIAVRLAGSGYAVPGTVIAVGLLLPLGWIDHRINAWIVHVWGASAAPGLIFTGSIIAVVTGYQARFLAVSLGLIESGLSRVRKSFDDAARVLGRSRRGVLSAIHLPLLRSSIVAAVLLVFVDVVKELPVTLILRPFDFETLAVRVYQLAADERLDEAATGAIAIMVIGIAPALLLARLASRRKLEDVHL